MPDPAITASGERFARDMRRIREEHGVSMDDIHDETMISTHIIESFEQDGLFEHPTFNRVYLRSFMRSYATAAGIDPDTALEQLERALQGEYANELAVTYLGDEPLEETPEPAPAPDSEADEPSGDGDPAPESRSAAERSGDAASDRAEASAPDVLPETPSQKGKPAPAQPDEGEAADESGPDAGRRGVMIGIGLVLAAVIAWVLIDGLGGSDASGPNQSAATMADTADTARLQPVPAESLAAAPRVALDDTLYFTLIAQERLNPIRIRRDEDLRRPYYFNRGQAGVFPARQQIIVEGELPSIRLLINGHEYPLQARGLDDRVVITRDTVQAFLDTTQTTPLSLVVPVDTFQVLGG